MHPLKKARRLAIVNRWSILPTIRQQNVAEHTFQVLVLARNLSEYHSGYCTAMLSRVTRLAINHDLDEAVKGDEPGGPWYKPKDYMQLVKQKGQDWAVVKMADLLDAYLFLMEEWQLGNKQIEPVMEAYFDEIHSISAVIKWLVIDGRTKSPDVREIVRNSTGFAKGDYV